MSIINKINRLLYEQLSSKDFDLLAGVFGQGDEFGVDAAISILRDKLKAEMETLATIAPKHAMKNIDAAGKKFLKPLEKALNTLEGDPLNKAKFKKAEKLWDDFAKKVKSLI